ncbi:MAG: hypothetical protein HY811_04575 [Planctomycetes bacterium]|nr:hypothetical protein [Planctomycetota bacterium]
MNKNALKYPPLTAADLLVIRGKPMAKIFKPSKYKLPLDKLPQTWVYCKTNGQNKMTEEHYIFECGYMVGWKQVAI